MESLAITLKWIWNLTDSLKVIRSNHSKHLITVYSTLIKPMPTEREGRIGKEGETNLTCISKNI